MNEVDQHIKFGHRAVDQLAFFDDTFKAYPKAKFDQADDFIEPWLSGAPGSPPRITSDAARYRQEAEQDLSKAMELLTDGLSVIVRFVAGPLQKWKARFLTRPENESRLVKAFTDTGADGEAVAKQFFEAIDTVTEKATAARFSDRCVASLFQEGLLGQIFHEGRVRRFYSVVFEESIPSKRSASVTMPAALTGLVGLIILMSIAAISMAGG